MNIVLIVRQQNSRFVIRLRLQSGNSSVTNNTLYGVACDDSSRKLSHNTVKRIEVKPTLTHTQWHMSKQTLEHCLVGWY